MSTSKQSICPECNGLVVLNTGEYICTSCGLVIDQFYEPPLTTLDTDNPRSKGALGARLHIVDGLGSYIDYHNTRNFRDKKGSVLSTQKQALFKRLKFRYNLYGRVKNQQTDYRILRILNEISVRLNLPNHIRDTAAYHYRKIRQKQSHKITNHIILIAVCLILSIREHSNIALITLKEMCSAFRKLGHRVNERQIIRAALQLRVKLGYVLKIRKSEDYITKIISKITSNPDIKNNGKQVIVNSNLYWQKLSHQARNLLNSIPSLERGGRNPYVFAAAIIYGTEQNIALKENRKPMLTQKQIAKIVDVAEYSIRDHYCSLIKKHLN